MKKSAKPIIVSVLSLLLIITALLLVTIAVRLKYDELTRKKVKVENTLKTVRTRKVNLIAEYQTFSAEGRIVNIAKERLNLIKRTSPELKITVSKKQIDQLNRKINSQYE